MVRPVEGMLVVFLHICRDVHREFLSQGQTVNGKFTVQRSVTHRLLSLPQSEIQAEGSVFWHGGGDPVHAADDAWHVSRMGFPDRLS